MEMSFQHSYAVDCIILFGMSGNANPEAWVFKGSIYATLKANICGECGYTELIANDPAALYNEYLKGESQRTR